MNKHQSLKSAQSLLERASSLYGFDNAMRSKTSTDAEKLAENEKPADNIDNKATEKTSQAETVQPPAKAVPPAKTQMEDPVAPPVVDHDMAEAKRERGAIIEAKAEMVKPVAESVPAPIPALDREAVSTSSKPLSAPIAPKTQTMAPMTGSSNAAHTKNIRKIDRQWLNDNNMIVPDGPVTSLSEEFRIVKRQLLLAARGGKGVTAVENGERILICSANPNEGKTYTSANLALSLASEKDNRVLLIDADFAKPSILSTLNIEGGPGLMDALADPNLDVNEMVLETDVDGLSVLPAGSQSNQDTEYLAAARTAKVIEKLSQDDPNRIIIFDSPPALAASPASVLALHVGQTLMVVHADKTTDSALRDALNLLSGCDHVQLLLNRANFSPSGRKFGSYYGYGA